MEPNLQSLHETFCKLTDADPQLLKYQACERSWYDFVEMGFTRQHLEMVIAQIKWSNRQYSYKRNFRFRNIIGDLQRFADDLMESERRTKRKATPKESALGDFRGFIPARPGSDAVALKELLKRTTV